MNYETAKFRLRGTSELLGGCPLSKEIYSNYVAAKAEKAVGAVNPQVKAQNIKNAQEDVESVIDRLEEGNVTGFYRDKNDGLVLKAYQIKGFLKEAAKAMRSQINVAQSTPKIDNYVFFGEREVPIMRGDTQVMEPDGFLERPLRGETAQGPRVALAKSEMVTGDWYVDITIKVLPNDSTAKSRKIDMDLIEEILGYGEFKGLLQWRNAGYGTFTFKRLP